VVIISVALMKRRATIFILIWLTAAVSPAKSVAGSGASELTIPFEVNRQFGSILIQVRVNGRPAVLLVDTGSSHTVLSGDILGVSPLFLRRASAPVKGSALTGIAAWAVATIDVGTMRWPDQRVLVMDGFSDISKGMKEKVDGLIGEDLLKEFGSVVIDFKNHRLLLHR
jgi:hypothetical protein